MTMPLSGAISLQDLRTEFGLSSVASISLKGAEAHWIAELNDENISIKNLYGKSLKKIFDFTSVGDFTVVVPPSVIKAAVYVRGGGGGGGGGGGAGEYGWGSSASGGGGGGGGAGRVISKIIDVVPGSTLGIHVGSGGAGGIGGDGSWSAGGNTRRNGATGTSGSDGGVSWIYRGSLADILVMAGGGAGGAGGAGAPGDSPAAAVAGGNGGWGYPAGIDGRMAYTTVEGGGYVRETGYGLNDKGGDGGAGGVTNGTTAGDTVGSAGGNGGRGGQWLPAGGEGYYPPDRIGRYGDIGKGGVIQIAFLRDPPIVVENQAYSDSVRIAAPGTVYTPAPPPPDWTVSG